MIHQLSLAHAQPFSTRPEGTITNAWAHANPRKAEKLVRTYYAAYGVCPPLFPKGFVSPEGSAFSVNDGKVPDAWNDEIANISIYELTENIDGLGHHWKKIRGDDAEQIRIGRLREYDRSMRDGDVDAIETKWMMREASDSEENSLESIIAKETAAMKKVPLNDGKSTAKGTPTGAGGLAARRHSEYMPGSLPSDRSRAGIRTHRQEGVSNDTGYSFGNSERRPDYLGLSPSPFNRREEPDGLGNNPPASVVSLQEEMIRRRMANEQRIADAQVAALNAQAAAAAVNATPSARTAAVEDAAIELSGEITPAVRNILRLVPGVPLSQVLAISKHEFVPENLYRLRRTYDRSKDEIDSTMELSASGGFIVKKARGKIRDFGESDRIWSEGFLNYARIIGYLFPQHSDVPLAMMQFHQRVQELSRIYTWTSVFNFAMDYHHLIRSDSVLVTEPWMNVPNDFLHSYCTAGSQRRPAGVEKKDRFSPYARDKEGSANDATVVCRNFNTKGCNAESCKRRHECLKCGGKDHNALRCSK